MPSRINNISRAPDVSCSKHVRGARLQPDGGPIDLRKVLRPTLRDGGDLGGRRLRRGVWFQQAEHLQRGKGPPIRFDVGFGSRAERTSRRRHIDVHFIRIVRHRRENPDDRVRTVIHLEHLADDVGIAAELGPPISMAQDQHRLRPLVIVCANERAADQRLDAEHVEEVGRDDARRDPIGFAATEQVEAHLVELDQAVETGQLRAVVVAAP